MIRKIIKNTLGITLIFLICGNFVNAEVIPDWSFVSVEPFNLIEPSNIANPILTASDIDDVNASFVADPFLIHDNGMWYLFFEVFIPSLNRGEIGVATSHDGLNWSYDRIVLSESFHLSYPLVLKYNGEYYMIPETGEANSIRVYKANNFPYSWSYITTIASGRTFVDNTIFRYNNKWWMFTADGKDKGALYLFYSSNLLSGWIEHPQSPIIKNDKSKARPGGRSFVFDNNRIIRLAQKNDITYGQRVRAFEVDTLTETVYAEHEIPESPIIYESGTGWNAFGMHQFDPWWTGSYWLCAVDGDNSSLSDDGWSIGIYVNDTDTDSDGVPDYIDGCINDPNKTQPGLCGCGVVDTDSDGDGIPDCNDNCSNDPNKAGPGICGCGVADTDSDGDGIADCNDDCNNLIDSDSDGTNDCDDLCPNDPNKTRPGICGCGIVDTDPDGDGIPDCVNTDADNDGLSDREEQGPEGNDPKYDGNNDGIPDGLQNNVVSFHTYDNQNYVTLESPAGTSIRNSKATDDPSPTNAPSGMEFSYGFFEFIIDSVGIGDATTVTLHLPVGKPIDTYYKYGPTPNNPTNHWYEFLYDGQAGAEITGNVITLHFVDGLRGDDDHTSNGEVFDVGAPAIAIKSSGGNTTVNADSGGGGGCFIATAVYGSLMEPHVKILREFRDRFLITNTIGISFVKLYYKYSPPLANFIAEHNNLRAMVRISLLPVIGISWLALKIGILSTVAIMFIFMSCFVLFFWFRRRYKE